MWLFPVEGVKRAEAFPWISTYTTVGKLLA